MSGEQVLSLLAYQVLMSLLSVGGVITLASEQHRYMVLERGWLTDAQFQASITLAQVAPGPNVLFLALWGWHVGLNAATASGAAPWLVWAWAAAGMAIGLLGGLVPSSLLALAVTRWSRRHAERVAARALRLGLAPIVVGAMFATAWVLAQTADADPSAPIVARAVPWALAAASALLLWRTRVHLLVLLGGGAVAGWVHHALL